MKEELNGTGMVLIDKYKGQFYGTDQKDLKRRPIYVVHYDVSTDDVYYLKQSSSQKVKTLNQEGSVYTVTKNYKKKKKDSYILMSYLYKGKMSDFDIKTTAAKGSGSFIYHFNKFKEDVSVTHDSMYLEIRHLFDYKGDLDKRITIDIPEKNVNNMDKLIYNVAEGSGDFMLYDNKVHIDYSKVLYYGGEFYLNNNFDFYKLIGGYRDNDLFIQDTKYLQLTKKLDIPYKKVADMFYKEKSGFIPLTLLLEQYQSNYKTQDFVIIEKDGKYGIIDYDGNELLQSEYDAIQKHPVKGMYVMKRNDMYGLLDADGEIILECEYSYDKVEDYVTEEINGPYEEVL